MRLVLEPRKDIVDWVAVRAGFDPSPSDVGMGVTDDSCTTMLAACVFTWYTGYNICAHVAIVDPIATRFLLRAGGRYIFDQLNCSRLTLITDSTNLAAIELHRRLGAIHEGTLKGASRTGDDILLSRISRDSEIWGRINGRRQRRERTSSSELLATA